MRYIPVIPLIKIVSCGLFMGATCGIYKLVENRTQEKCLRIHNIIE